MKKQTLYQIKSYLLRVYEKIFCRKIFQPLNNILYDFALVGKSIGGSTDISKNGEGNFIKSLSKIYKNQKCVVFDVGANIGDYSSAILNHFQKTVIYLFEPHPKSFASLRKKFDGQENIKLYKIGLGSSIHKSKLYDYVEQDGSAHASIFNDMFKSFYEKETKSYDIEILTLDSIVEKENLEYIDLLKIDVEGGELEVLKGAKKTLSENKIKIIQFEFNYTHIFSRVFLKDFYDILPNFDFYRLLIDGLWKIKYDAKNEIFMIQNIIAINKNYSDTFKDIL